MDELFEKSAVLSCCCGRVKWLLPKVKYENGILFSCDDDNKYYSYWDLKEGK